MPRVAGFRVAWLVAVMVLAASAVVALPANIVRAQTPITDCSPANVVATLEVPGDYEFACPGGAVTITLTEEINVTSGVTVVAGNGVTLSGGGATRLFNVLAGAQLSLDNLTLTNGAAADGGAIGSAGTVTITHSTLSDNAATMTGGAIYSSGSLNIGDTRFEGNTASIEDSVATAGGGAIFAQGGNVTITASTFHDNRVFIEGGAAVAGGGAILNNVVNLLSITDSTFSANSTVAEGIFATPGGGAILSNVGTTINVLSSTFSGNSATLIGSGAADGGGAILVNVVSAMTIAHSTFSGNSVTGGDLGTIRTNVSSVSLRSTIVANSEGPNCTGAVTSLGYNLSDDASCALAGPGDQSDTPADLGPLQDNGGPTETHLPSVTSAAIDQGDCSYGGAPTTDQRGAARVVDVDDIPNAVDGCDVGAVEVGGFIADTATVLSPAASPVRWQAGDPIYVKFRLVEPLGLAILAAGSPEIQQISCTSGAPIGPPRPAQLVGGLRFFSSANYYQLIWRTQAGWANTCYAFSVRFVDGSSVGFDVRFTPNR